jgi:hypothetical protein
MAVPGGADFTLTITGTNFDSTAVVNWGSTTLTPTNITSTQITVTVPAAQIAKAGTADVTVTEDDGTSNSETFTIATFIGGKVLSGPSSNGTAISASVQLYAAGTSGYGTGPQKVGSEVQSDSKTGAFAVTYDCSALTTPGGDQLYLVAQGSTSGTVLMTALGSCNSISSSFPSGVTINEATTIASAYALSAFASIDSNGGIDIGAPANTTTGTQCDPTDNWKSTGPSTCNYIGLKNAFATVQNLVDVASGAACVITPAYSSSHSCLSTSGSTPKYNISYVPQQRVNSLANVLAACANPSAGGAACDSLFTGATATGSNQPKDTLQAALSIALHPGNNANQIAGLVPSTPFTPTISSSDAGLLTDWALAVVYEGAGIGRDALSGMAIDAAGNVWLTAYNGYAVSYGGANITPNTIGYVAVFNNQGGPLSPAATSSTLGGYNGNGIYNPQAIAIDQNGYAWIGNYPTATTIAAGNPGSVSVLDVHGSPQYGTGTTPFTNQVLLNPNGFGIAVDAGNTVWVSSNASTANHINCSSGTYGGSILPLTGSASGGVTVAGNAVDTYSDSSSCPSHLAIDLNNNLWTYDHSQSGGKDPHSGLKLFGPDGSSVAGPYYYDNQIQNSNIAIDSNGNGWLFDANYNTSNGTVDVISPAEIGSNNAEPGKQLYVVDYWGSMYWSEGSSPVVLDGASQAWTANNNEEGGNQGYLFETNSSDTALLSPMASDGTPWGFVGWDASSGTPNPLDTAARSPLEVDGSGNLWLANGSQLSEFIGIAVPTRTPLGSALVGSNTPGTRP